MALESVKIKFASGVDLGLHLRGVIGRERISSLYEFVLQLWRPEGKYLTDDELDSLMLKPCAISLGPSVGHVVHGILRQIDSIDAASNEAPVYYAVMVPTVWLLTLNSRNRVFQNKSTQEIVTEVLSSYQMLEHPDANADFEFRGVEDSTAHEYVVQYQESDWDFIQRWLERDGLAYWFEDLNQYGLDAGLSAAKKERLVIGPVSAHASAIHGQPEVAGQEPPQVPHGVAYRYHDSQTSLGLATVWNWTHRIQRTPRGVAIVDYNYHNPNQCLHGKAEVGADGCGFGTVFSFGDHHLQTLDDGARLAGVRLEHLVSKRHIFSGETDCSRFRPGHAFALEGHPGTLRPQGEARSDDGDYLLLSCEHRVGFEMFEADPSGQPLEHRYRGRFESIPKDVPFRPARVTPWPKVQGLISAHVAGRALATEHAEIDEYALSHQAAFRLFGQGGR